MFNIGSYEKALKKSSWNISEKELEYKKGGVINIGWYCSDRICQKGKGDKLALIWEGFAGEEKKFTFNDIRQLTNTIARFLQKLGIRPGERVCLFMDQVPELYLGFLGILKLGAIAQPLFSAFGPESLHTRLEDAGDRGHLHPEEARGQGAHHPRATAGPAPRDRGRRRRQQAAARAGGRLLHGKGGARRRLRQLSRHRPKPPRCCTTPPAPPASPRAPSTSTML